MNKPHYTFRIFYLLLFASILFSCTNHDANNNSRSLNLEALSNNGGIDAIIEIPAGTIEKWELNKEKGIIERDSIQGKPRTINYLGYPANYGMIPNTILSKENGGDGDPLDVLVIGRPVERGATLSCKVIGILYLVDDGEQDDKLIAIADASPLNHINTFNDLKEQYSGIAEIIELWFTNYKGAGKMESKGFRDQKEAIRILEKARQEYNQSNN